MPDHKCDDSGHVWPWGSDYCECGEFYVDDDDDDDDDDTPPIRIRD
jgi:hypothetical protein